MKCWPSFFRFIALTATGRGKVLIDTAHRATVLCDFTLIIKTCTLRYPNSTRPYRVT